MELQKISRLLESAANPLSPDVLGDQKDKGKATDYADSKESGSVTNQSRPVRTREADPAYYELIDRLALLGSAASTAQRLGLIVGPDFADNAEDGEKVQAKFDLGKEIAATKAYFTNTFSRLAEANGLFAADPITEIPTLDDHAENRR